MLADDHLPRLRRPPGVDPERLDPEHCPDHVPARASLVGVAVDLVEPQHPVALRHLASRNAASTTGSIRSLPSTRSSRFSTPAQSSSGGVAEGCQALVDLGPEGIVDGKPVRGGRLAEQRVMKAEEALQLLDRPLVVVGAEVDERVREPGVASVSLDDEQGRRLLAAAVASRRLRGGKAVERAARRAAGRPTRGTCPPARRPLPPRRGCCPGPRIRHPPVRRPTRGTPSRCTSRRARRRRRHRAGAARDRRRRRSVAPRPRRRSSRSAAGPAPRGRSAGWRRTGSRSRPRAGRPTGRPSRPRGTSTGSRRPTGRRRDRRRRSSRSRRRDDYP